MAVPLCGRRGVRSAPGPEPPLFFQCLSRGRIFFAGFLVSFVFLWLVRVGSEWSDVTPRMTPSLQLKYEAVVCG